MNYRKYVLSIILASSIGLQSFAQDESDALRYSYLSPMGTARSIGFGNALGSIGGDFSSLAVNPAGIGIYRRSEFTFTPGLRINSTSGNYLGNTESDNNVRFTVNNLGLVLTNSLQGQRYERSGWKAVSFGIGMTKLADFNRDYSYSGQNSGPNSSSYSELFTLDANSASGNVNDQTTLGGMAYNAYLIDYDSANGLYKTRVPWASGIMQGRTVRERGSLNEWDISFGGNYMEQLIVGATLGIPTLTYKRDATVTETANTATTGFSSYRYNENLITKGTGINLKLGVIYKANDFLRFGVAIHTPTYYGMHDDYTTTLNNAGFSYVPTNTSTYDYSMVTPWRAVFSMAVIAGKNGFITADYETVNYSTAKFIYDASNKALADAVNKTISGSFQPTSIFRIGGELKLTDYFMVRAGMGYYGSPYQSQIDNANRIDVSGGFGFRMGDMFLDFALQHTQYSNPELFYYLNYSPSITQSATIKNSLNTGVVTIGFKL